VHVTDRIPDRVWNALQRDFETADDAAGVDGILASVTVTVDGSYLDAAGSELRVVANYGAGVNNIDLAAASQRGIVVANTPDVVTTATAEFTIALILALLRRIAEGDRLLRRGEPWQFSLEFMLGESLADKTLGIIGPGRIGREVARLAEAFGARTLFAGRHEPLAPLLAAADIVSVHCPLTEETRHLIDAGALARMRDDAYLVNSARGPIVDEAALAAALRDGVIAGAALDVFENEPEVHPDLVGLDNAVLVPHLGSATVETRTAMAELAAENVLAVLAGEDPPTPVT
jgi:glyoxylate reductase